MLRRVKWIGRYILNATTILSLLLCIGTGILWIRSYHKFDRFVLKPAPQSRLIYAFSGKLYFWKDMGWPDLSDPTWGHDYTRQFLGFGSSGGLTRSFDMERGIAYSVYGRVWFAPLWSFLLAFLVLPVRFAFVWSGRRTKTTFGLCPLCGYDLRASTDRCPECGTVTPKKDQPQMNADQRR